MNEVPNIISTKDLAYIKDMLKWNMVIAKKTNMYIHCINDTKVKNLMKKVYKMHVEQYKTLMDILG